MERTGHSHTNLNAKASLIFSAKQVLLTYLANKLS